MATSATDFNLGKNIQTVRKNRAMTIKELAQKVAVSTSLLSQIERGLANPSIATMKAIADALHEPLYNFFLPDFSHSETRVSRAATRPKYTFSPSTAKEMVSQQRPAGYECERLSSLETPNMEMLRVKLPPQCSSNPIPRQHEDTEIAYVESGTVTIQIGNDFEALYPHDSISILPNTPHRWINESDETVYLILSMSKISQ